MRKHSKHPSSWMDQGQHWIKLINITQLNNCHEWSLLRNFHECEARVTINWGNDHEWQLQVNFTQSSWVADFAELLITSMLS